MEDFVVIKFGKYFKSTKEKIYPKLFEEQNIRKVAEWLYIFLTTSDKVGKYTKMMQLNSSVNCVYCYNIKISNLFDPDLQLINFEPMIKNKRKQLLSELKKFKVQSVLILQYKKINHCKIFHSSVKLIASDSDIDEAFKYMHQSIMTKIKKLKYSIKIFEC